MITIHALASGSTMVDEALPFADRSKNPRAYTGLFRSKKHKAEVPVRDYLVSFPQGNILIDTGLDRAIRKKRKEVGRIRSGSSCSDSDESAEIPL